VSQGLCLFGGSFDPPHATHLRMAKAAAERLRPERFVVMPCAQNPLKANSTVATAEQRVAMCRLAFAEIPRAEVSTLEIERGTPSYTIDTVLALRSEIGIDPPLWILCGADVLPQLDRWKEVHSLLEIATLVVCPRVGQAVDARTLDRLGIRRRHKEGILENLLPIEADATSSTAIRAALAAGRTPEGLSPRVFEFIQRQRLYLDQDPR
jgi:nicotinate-nucleotide adenylyltransferase